MADPIVLMFDDFSLGLTLILVLDLFESLLDPKKEGLTMLLVDDIVQMALAGSDYGYVLAHRRFDLLGPSK